MRLCAQEYVHVYVSMLQAGIDNKNDVSSCVPH